MTADACVLINRAHVEAQSYMCVCMSPRGGVLVQTRCRTYACAMYTQALCVCHVGEEPLRTAGIQLSREP